MNHVVLPSKEYLDLVEKNQKLEKACAETYQVLGQLLLFDDVYPEYTNHDIERALDNLVAAINNEPEPHEDLIPWPKREI